MSDQAIAEQYEHAGCVVKIMYDDDPLNPRVDYSNESTMWCWHRRATLGDEDHGVDDSECESVVQAAKLLIREYKARIILPLFLYEHSGMTMRAGEPFVVGAPKPDNPFHDPWDSGQVGFIFQTAEQIRSQFLVKRISKNTLARAIEGLKSEVEVYDSYLRGDCYGYIVERQDGEHVGSCWGFLGYESTDEIKSEANAEAEYEFEQQKKRNGEALMQKTLQEVMA